MTVVLSHSPSHARSDDGGAELPCRHQLPTVGLYRRAPLLSSIPHRRALPPSSPATVNSPLSDSTAKLPTIDSPLPGSATVYSPSIVRCRCPLQKMQPQGKGVEEQGEGSGPMTWNTASSSFMLNYLAKMVAKGTRTSSGFKKVHLNMCARALNDHFKTKYTGENIKNHLRTWNRRYSKILRLRNLSAAGWDKDNCIITLDEEHYVDHVAGNKADAEFFNKPLEHYTAMATIFGNSMATEKFAKGSNEPLGVADAESEARSDSTGAPTTPSNSTDVPITGNDEQGASSSATRPNKRAKTADSDVDLLVGAITSSTDKLAKAIEKLANSDMDLPVDLYPMLKSLPGFNNVHISFYYSHLVANPHIGKAFYNLPFDAKIDWVADFINEKFPGK